MIARKRRISLRDAEQYSVRSRPRRSLRKKRAAPTRPAAGPTSPLARRPCPSVRAPPATLAVTRGTALAEPWPGPRRPCALVDEPDRRRRADPPGGTPIVGGATEARTPPGGILVSTAPLVTGAALSSPTVPTERREPDGTVTGTPDDGWVIDTAEASKDPATQQLARPDADTTQQLDTTDGGATQQPGRDGRCQWPPAGPRHTVHRYCNYWHRTGHRARAAPADADRRRPPRTPGPRRRPAPRRGTAAAVRRLLRGGGCQAVRLP
ncbi:hypothetical protein HBB16_08835 [Pseudonocardia sp. MCCB 268]|nr:hypothetical protein [Pseudonocardia cytotoxica]